MLDPFPELLDDLLQRQRSCWEAGAQIRISDLLQHISASSITADIQLDLIYHEFVLRSEFGDAPNIADYVKEYPQLAGALTALFEVHEALDFRFQAAANPSASSNLLNDSPGSRIHQFRLVDRLGEGTFGTVWRAWDESLERHVALKVPRQTILPFSARRQFIREARAIARVNHRNIVAVFEVVANDSEVYIVSELINGCNLRAFCQGKPLKPHVAAQICHLVAKALGAAHDAGVIHRDLKPQNVLIDQQGTPFLTDFGLAINASATVPEGEASIAGTPAYMSPEQTSGERTIDKRTDIFSLGVVFFELLAGCRPTEPMAEQAARQMPDELSQICSRALQVDREKRYPTAHAMAEDIAKWIASQDLDPRERAARHSFYWRIARRGWQVLAVALAIVVGIVLVGTRERVATEGKMQRVCIATLPPGASVYAFPLDSYSGEPVPGSRIAFRRGSTLRASLPPGDYLLVTVLDDKRFHEVYRHVPAGDENLPGAFNHLKWKRLGNGEIELPQIRIPSSGIENSMALFGSHDHFTMGSSKLPDCPEHPRRIAAFYMDTHEVSMEEYSQQSGRIPVDTRSKYRSAQHAVLLNYNQAVQFAESIGKRLPDEGEFELAASQATIPESFPASDAANFEPVGSAEDQTATIPAVRGLLSNVAEWTSSAGVPYPSGTVPGSPLASGVFRDHRIVRGGSQKVIEGADLSGRLDRNPHDRIAVSPHAVKPGLGFRCVRSARPRLLESDFSKNL